MHETRRHALGPRVPDHPGVRHGPAWGRDHASPKAVDVSETAKQPASRHVPASARERYGATRCHDTRSPSPGQSTLVPFPEATSSIHVSPVCGYVTMSALPSGAQIADASPTSPVS